LNSVYKKMLVPLDGSELSEVTFKYAKELAGRFSGLEVILFHVCDAEDSCISPLHRTYIDHSVELIKEDAVKQAGGKDVNVHGELALGNPADEILRYAEKHKMDLVLMATHGHSGVSRWAMGSVAYKVLRTAKIPVWLVRAGIEEAIILDKLPERRILVPLDGTRSAEAILPYVEKLARQWGSDVVQIILVRVCDAPDISSDYPANMPVSWEEHVAQETLKCKLVAGSYLAGIERNLKDAGFKVRSELPVGKPSREIVNSSVKNRANVIAMIIHGRSGISRWAYGNTAEEVMLEALTPILLIRS
jgi:nucleotide-binding universal stress UspA family protein